MVGEDLVGFTTSIWNSSWLAWIIGLHAQFVQSQLGNIQFMTVLYLYIHRDGLDRGYGRVEASLLALEIRAGWLAGMIGV